MIKFFLFSTSFLISNICISQNEISTSSSILKGCKYKIYKYPNGNKKEEGCLIKNKKEGLWKEYAEQDGKILFIWTYEKDTKNGTYYHFNDGGNIDAKGQYFNGLLSDTLKHFDDEGKIIKIDVWEPNFKTMSSNLIYEKNYNAKPDNTIEIIDGKRYIWDKGKRYELIEKIK